MPHPLTYRLALFSVMNMQEHHHARLTKRKHKNLAARTRIYLSIFGVRTLPNIFYVWTKWSFIIWRSVIIIRVLIFNIIQRIIHSTFFCWLKVKNIFEVILCPLLFLRWPNHWPCANTLCIISIPVSWTIYKNDYSFAK